MTRAAPATMAEPRPARSAALPVSRPDDPQEQAAERVAQGVARTSAPALGHADRETAASGEGRPLDGATRSWFESRFDTGLGGVRVHTGPAADRAAGTLAARAFTVGSDITFAAGQFAPDTAAGRRLLAHELTHVVQADPTVVRRQPAPDQATVSKADTIVRKAGLFDVVGVVAELERTEATELAGVRAEAGKRLPRPLERWLADRRAIAEAGADKAAIGVAERGIRRLWSVLSLLDKLEVYDEGARELEQAQLDVIRTTPQAERTAAAEKEPARLDRILALLDPTEEHQARKLIDSSPAGLYRAASRLLGRSPSFDTLFDALLDLRPAARGAFFREHLLTLFRKFSVAEFRLLSSLGSASEAQVLIARLRQATEGRLDDMEAVAAVVERAAALLQERATLQATVGSLTGPKKAEAQERLDELKDLDQLLAFSRDEKGALKGSTFLGMLAAARGDPGAFAADASRLAAFAPAGDADRVAVEIAKQRILLADGDARAIQSAIVNLRAQRRTAAQAPGQAGAEQSGQSADERLRTQLLADPGVAAMVNRLPESERMRVRGTVTADEFDWTVTALGDALFVADWGRFFSLTVKIARREPWRARFLAKRAELWGVYSRIPARQRTIVDDILVTGRLPLKALLGFTRIGEMGPDALATVLADLGETDRAQLRLGHWLATRPRTGPPTAAEAEALNAYKEFEAQVRASQTWLQLDEKGFHQVLWAALGSAPTADDWTSDEGRLRAAELMYQQQQARLALPRGVAADFTETDETMVAAAREFAARFEPLRAKGEMRAVDLAALSALHDRFLGRSTEFEQANNAISDMAAMIAATVAATVVVAATGGAATPAVILLAAGSGAGARVLTKEMFGGAYADTGARDVLLGAVDGALAVVGASLAARGAQLVGLGGHALTTTAARAAGAVAEEASAVAGRAGVTLARRVAAGAVEAALDGAFSGAVSEAVGALTDPGTWRRGVWRGLVQVGEAALVAGLAGLATGAVIGAAVPVVRAGLGRLSEAATLRGAESLAGATRGRDVYRIPYSEAVKKGKAGGVDPRRVRKAVQAMAGTELAHDASLAAGKAEELVILSVPRAGDAAAPHTEVVVKVQVSAPDDAVWTAASPLAKHDSDFGPTLLRYLRRRADGGWEAEVLVNAGLRTEDVFLTVKHELDEIADILARNPAATEADIARETRSAVFRREAADAVPTAHDRAEARELRQMHEDLVNERAKHRPDPDVIADKQARLDRKLRSMSLDDPASITAPQRALLQEVGVDPAFRADIVEGGQATRRATNFGRTVTDFREAQPMMSVRGGVTAPGHARSKHLLGPKERTVALDILNNPERVFTGTYEKSGRAVDLYWAKDSVVITDAGQKDLVVTAYGPAIDGPKGKVVDPAEWANDPLYREILR